MRILACTIILLLIAAPAAAQGLHFVYTPTASGDHKPVAFFPTQASADAAAAGDAALEAHPGAVAVPPGFKIDSAVWSVSDASWRSFTLADQEPVRRLRLLAKRFLTFMQGVGAATVATDWSYVGRLNFARVMLSPQISSADRIAFAEAALSGPAGRAPSSAQFLLHVAAQASAPTLDGFWVSPFASPIAAGPLDGDMFAGFTQAQRDALAAAPSDAEIADGSWRNDIP